jgi:hypothetical protein
MRFFIIVFTFLIVAPALSQEETLLGSGDVDHGGYGALVLKMTSVNDKTGLLVGARGGWIIDHTFCLGVAGYGLATNVEANTVGAFGQGYVNLGYGGVDLEFIANSDRLVHFSIHTLIGAGAVGFRSSWGDDVWNDLHFDEDWYEMHDTFFVIEPGVNVDLNITPWFRTSIGASYRYVSGVQSEASSDSGLRGASGMISFRFGSF